MKRLLYTINLLEPVLVTALDGDPNSSVSFDYLPGTALRGMIISRYIAAQKKRNATYQLDAAAETAGRLFFNGQTRYLNGYVCHESDTSSTIRACPVPRSLFREKGTKEPLYDFAGDEHPQDLEQPKPQTEGFALFEADWLRPVPVQKTIAVHTARNRRFGRAVGSHAVEDRPGEELTGAVYRYEALAPNQTFMAAILCEEEDAALLAPLLEGQGMLGGSRSAGYGRVRLNLLEIQDAAAGDETDWSYPAQEIDKDYQEDKAEVLEGRVIITLLSDVLLRDKSGGWAADPAQLCRALDLQLLPDLAFYKQRFDGSFNRKWGLPTTQMPVFAMGSVFVCQAPEEKVLQILTEKQAAGIGERRAEGFGRFAVNWYHGQVLNVFLDEPEAGHQLISLPDGSQARTVAAEIASRLLDRQIDQYILSTAASLARPQPGLQKSQVYRLQQEIMPSLQAPELDLESDRKRIDAYLEDLQNRAVTRKQFARTFIEDTERRFKGTLPDWMKMLLKENAFVWMDPAKDAKHIGDIGPLVDEMLVYRSNLRLINGVLSRIAKETKDH